MLVHVAVPWTIYSRSDCLVKLRRHIPYWHSKQVLIKLQDDFATFKEGGLAQQPLLLSSRPCSIILRQARP